MCLPVKDYQAWSQSAKALENTLHPIDGPATKTRKEKQVTTKNVDFEKQIKFIFLIWNVDP